LVQSHSFHPKRSHKPSVQYLHNPLIRHQLLHGWQRTHDSQLGGGDVPATPIAPAFTIEGFSDISFDQHSGWALRAGAKYQMTRHWLVEPGYIHWNVSASPVNYETTFTVNGVTVQQQLGAYEPLNSTNEFLKVGVHF
jgi:opacity protein-like surface antigen